MNLTQALHRARRHYPSRLATVFGSRRHDFDTFADRVARMAGALCQLGMKPGERVGILALNSDRFLELYFAVWWGGGAVNPVNIRWSAREIAYSLDDCDTHILVVDDAFAAIVGELCERSRSLRTLIHAGDGAAPSGMFDYEQLIADHTPVSDAMRANSDLAGVFYTGGTTGFPKGVMLSHANLVSNALNGLAERVVEEDDVALHVAPMFHLADGFFGIMLFLRGCTQVILPAFQPETVLQTVERERVNAILLVPTMIQMLVDHPRLSDYKLDSLRKLIYGASPISEALLDRAIERLPGARFTQAYGQTEMSPAVSLLGPDYHDAQGRKLGKFRSAGRPMLGVEIRIVDQEGRELPFSSVGEITARGAGVMQGYWNRPEQTAEAIRDGWMYTGDSGYLDQDGFLFIVDRVKDMIISGGENIYSAEVENAIAQHPAVASCAVIGIPDDHWGEAVHAVIVRKPGAVDFGIDELRDHCRALIAGYKCPRSLEMRDALPLSGAGKVLKITLREPYWQQRQRRVG
ncbi:acyl-CoA synthetase [Solimonas terrae]|uniref:Long-chain fatty acid--CoA ligase n=1 Tax=Solimonas terrae TaxID=1396819 RepID=A0A6M2BKP1_9GAMM|nr:long-chain fatty acid--CoA ligase [Solimonas terrae]NGY03306.1 long-chain fatty acid--CoA ligase [Solimonas terrae]